MKPHIGERPLASLPTAQAGALIRGLLSPGERFARAFHHYWRKVVGQPEHIACESTLAELGSLARAMLAKLDDPEMHTIGTGLGDAYQPIGIFGYRELAAHAHGRQLADVIATTHLGARYPGSHGIAHAVGILDAHANLDVLRHILASIARKALARSHRHLFFFTSDHRLKSLYRRLGMEFPADLGFRESEQLVGTFDLGKLENLERIVEIEQQLGLRAPALEPGAAIARAA